MMHAAPEQVGAVTDRPRTGRWPCVLRLPRHEGVLPRRRVGALESGHGGEGKACGRGNGELHRGLPPRNVREIGPSSQETSEG